jgi:uncharacterized glyoxalase superfamily protein PhnB
MSVKAVPDGFHTVTPHLILNDAKKAIAFYKNAFGAEELHVMPDPTGKIMHAEIQIGDSRVMLAEEYPEYGIKSAKTLGGSPVTVSLYVENADKVFKAAVDAGATATMPVADMFWGDRYGKLTDPFGHHWAIMTHVKDVSPEEMAKAAAEAFK